MGTAEVPPSPTLKQKNKSESPRFLIGESNEDFPQTFKDEELFVVPPDGGWGWVVVAASFLCNGVVDGIICTSGMLFPRLKQTFEVSNAEVAWISSLLGGFYLLAGPFASALANAFGFRTVCILGALVTSLACLLSYFATSIYYLYISYGILGGTGFGLIYVPAVIASGFYFEKKRALATGIAVCGSGIGTFAMSPLNAFLLVSLDEQWQLIFLVYGGLVLTCAVFGLAFRPLTVSTGKIKETSALLRVKHGEDTGELSATFSEKPFLANGDTKAATPMFTAENGSVAKILLDHHGGSKRVSYHGFTGADEPILEETYLSHAGQLLQFKDRNQNNNIEQTYVLDEINGGWNPPEKGAGDFSRIISAPLLPSAHSTELDRRSRLSLRTEYSRPFYRQDIFYSGSLVRLPQYQSVETVNEYHVSVTHIPAVAVEQEAKRECCPLPVTYVVQRIFDLSLLSSITFITLATSGFLTLVSLFIPFGFLPIYTISIGIEASEVSFLMSLLGIFNTVGRILAGWLSDHPKVDALLLNNSALMLGGAATILLPFLKDLSLLYAYAVLFGLCVATYASLRSILLVELLGLAKLTSAFGLLLLFQGIAAIFGSPIAGVLVDTTQEFNMSFYIFGGAFALSGVLCIPLRRIKRMEDKRRKKRGQKNTVYPLPM